MNINLFEDEDFFALPSNEALFLDDSPFNVCYHENDILSFETPELSLEVEQLIQNTKSIYKNGKHIVAIRLVHTLAL